MPFHPNKSTALPAQPFEKTRKKVVGDACAQPTSSSSARLELLQGATQIHFHTAGDQYVELQLLLETLRTSLA